MYIDQPDMLEARKWTFFEEIDCIVQKYNVDHLLPEIEKKFLKMWDVATSYWIFPDQEDLMKIVDDVFKENQPSNFIH